MFLTIKHYAHKNTYNLMKNNLQDKLPPSPNGNLVPLSYK